MYRVQIIPHSIYFKDHVIDLVIRCSFNLIRRSTQSDFIVLPGSVKSDMENIIARGAQTEIIKNWVTPCYFNRCVRIHHNNLSLYKASVQLTRFISISDKLFERRTSSKTLLSDRCYSILCIKSPEKIWHFRIYQILSMATIRLVCYLVVVILPNTLR